MSGEATEDLARGWGGKRYRRAARADAGRSTCSRRVGIRLPMSTISGAGGGAAALHRLQCSQACPGTRSGLPGASSPGTAADATLWQMTENGSTLAPLAAMGARPSRIACSATA